MMYLLYRVRDSIDGKRRVIQCFDEFHAYLDDPVIEREVKRGIKTDRKKDAIYVFATQEPNDALSSRIGRTIMSQTVTKSACAIRKLSERIMPSLLMLNTTR